MRPFWTAYGCTSLEASEHKLGAATFHRWRLDDVWMTSGWRLDDVWMRLDAVSFAIFRPFDSDYGLALKLQRYLQYQVVIKPFWCNWQVVSKVC
ncbi:MAG: glycine--tRNA ligase subunit alpha [Candidatus Hodgkinia cicadicola]